MTVQPKASLTALQMMTPAAHSSPGRHMTHSRNSRTPNWATHSHRTCPRRLGSCRSRTRHTLHWPTLAHCRRHTARCNWCGSRCGKCTCLGTQPRRSATASLTLWALPSQTQTLWQCRWTCSFSSTSWWWFPLAILTESQWLSHWEAEACSFVPTRPQPGPGYRGCHVRRCTREEAARALLGHRGC